jgi:hypothetical protein
MIEAIDMAADDARTRVVGDPVRVFEYTVAETDAGIFAAAGYTGTVPVPVAIWAQAKNWTAQQAADDILSASRSWQMALMGLRQARLIGKEGVRSAVSDEDAVSRFELAISTIKGILLQAE